MNIHCSNSLTAALQTRNLREKSQQERNPDATGVNTHTLPSLTASVSEVMLVGRAQQLRLLFLISRHKLIHKKITSTITAA